MGKRKKAAATPLAESYRHSDVTALMRPDVGTQTQFRKKKPPATYRYDSSLSPALDWDDRNHARDDGEKLIREILEAKSLEEAKAAAGRLKAIARPFLNWAGKAERLSFDVPTLPLFVHERLSTQAILHTLAGHRKSQETQLDLFGDPQHSIADQVLRAYEYQDGWVNRMVLGDSLVVMNSLLHCESLGGQVQMIYMDPPYGVKFGSNFQPFVRKRDVKNDDDDDMTREPEMVQAYRDTWELGLHSYLTYLRDRLLLCRELLAPSGSIFVQISDENLHHVREVMDEVFGAENFVAIIAFTKGAAGLEAADRIPARLDYIVWYARDIDLAKYRPIFERRADDIASGFGWVELTNGERRRLVKEERSGAIALPKGAKLFGDVDITKPGPGAKYEIEFSGRRFDSGKRWWGTPKESLQRVIEANRVLLVGNRLRFVKYADDFSFAVFGNLWDGLAGAKNPLYVVQTNAEVMRRCIQMTTDPGDLVLDPTCVRRGTRVWATTANDIDCDRGNEPFPQLAQRAEHLPPFTGGSREGVACRLTPIEHLRPGDLVIGYDRLPHPVRRVIEKPHRGWMVCLRTDAAEMPLWLTTDHRVLARLRPRTLGGDRDWSGSPEWHQERRRELRRDGTVGERKLWSVLRGASTGFKFRRQHSLGPYIADFYSRDAHLVVEIDGDWHFTPEGRAHDRSRDAFLRGLGLDVLRVTADEVDTNLEGIWLGVQNQCRLRTETVVDAR